MGRSDMAKDERTKRQGSGQGSPIWQFTARLFPSSSRRRPQMGHSNPEGEERLPQGHKFT